MSIRANPTILYGLSLLGLFSCQNNQPTANRQDSTQTTDSLKPVNILWITCEDMSPRLGCYGDETARTPHLDSLAHEGIRYTNVFSVSGVCAPSRAALITGMYPISIGAQHMRTIKRTSALDKVTDPELLAIPVYEAVPPPEVKCFTEYLRKEGYYCTNNYKTDYQFHTPITAWDECSKEAHWRNRPQGMPFFAVFNIGITHESQVWARADEALTTKPENVPLPPYYPDDSIIRRDIARHYSNIHLMDQRVGELLQELEEDGLADNTIVFFYSDHGDGLPRMKRWLFDSGLRVPLIIRFPDGREAGTVNRELISFVDFAPSVLSLLDIKIPDYMQGQAFLGNQKADKERRAVYAAKDRMDPTMDCQRAVRDLHFKYIHNYMPDKPYVQTIPYRDQMPLMQQLKKYHQEGRLNSIQEQWFASYKPKEELYDTHNDPHELNNLSADLAYAHVLDTMRNLLDDWLERTNDQWRLEPESKMVKAFWPPDGQQPRTQVPVFEIKNQDFTDKLTIRLSCPTPGASIAYRIGDDEHWWLYTDRGITIDQSCTIHAKAIRIGYKHSLEVKREFNKNTSSK